MAVKMFTESVEAATITLTNGGAASDEKLLKNRDLRVKGLDVASGSTAVTVEIDYGTSTTFDYVILGNLLTDSNNDVDVDYWTGAAWVNLTTDTINGNNTNHYITFSSQAATKIRVVFSRTAATQLELACIFTGQEYAFPVNYYFNNNRGSHMRGEVLLDQSGYPYTHQINSAKKRLYSMEFGLTGAQLLTLESQFETIGYNQKPLFFFDNNIDSIYHLVHFPSDRLEPEQPGANYFRVPINLVEL